MTTPSADPAQHGSTPGTCDASPTSPTVVERPASRPLRAPAVPRARATAAAAAAVVLLTLAACGTPAPAPPAPPTTSAPTATPTTAPSPTAPTPLPASALAALDAVAGQRPDYQLAGAYPPPDGATIVVRDVTDPPAGAGYDVCYVNGFQTQPGETERWLAERPDLVLHDASGEPVADEGWPDELLLDTSTPATREALAEEIGALVDACAAAGYDAVEPDNLDSFSRSGGLLTVEDNLALAALLVERAHGLGLAIAQKNSVELGERGRDLGFDLVVAEDCEVYDECGDYAAVYGRRMIEIEYSDTPDAAAVLERACAARGRGPDAVSVVGRDRALSLPGTPGYVVEHC